MPPSVCVQFPHQAPGSLKTDGQAQGPLAGIVTALSNSSAERNLILACDLPYLTTEWLDWLLSKAVLSAAQAVLPKLRAASSRLPQFISASVRSDFPTRLLAESGPLSKL